MLRYDAAWLLEQYCDEALAAPGIPYAPLGGDGPYRAAAASRRPFTGLRSSTSAPQLDFDETVVRLARYEERNAVGAALPLQRRREIELRDGWARRTPSDAARASTAVVFRRLPTARLSNGIGTTVVVFDAAGRPYLPRRAPRQCVFPGGYHCTASGETVWREGALEFDRLFTENICRELEEEVGLDALSISSGFVRSPSAASSFAPASPSSSSPPRTLLPDAELQSRRRAAIAAQLARGRQEILDDVLREFRPDLCTIECLANVALARHAITLP